MILAMVAVAPWRREREHRRQWTRADLLIAGFLMLAIAVRLVVPAGPAGPFSPPLALMTIAAGLVLWRASRSPRVRRMFSPRDLSCPGFYVCLTVASVVLSFGPVIRFFGYSVAYGPYGLLYAIVPGFQGIRAPARFHMIAMLGIAVLTGLGLAAVLRRVRKGATLVAVTLITLTLADYASVPIGIAPQPGPSELPDAYRWIAHLPDDIVVAELPIAPLGQPWRECDLVYYSAFHRKRIVNGYSGYFPPANTWLQREVERSGVSTSILDYLEQIGVGILLVRRGTTITQDAYARLALVRTFPDVGAYHIRPAS
jgi:hypothetical protein